MSITTNQITDDFSRSISPVGQASRLSPPLPIPHSLLQDFLNGTLGLCQLAELHNISLQQLEHWLQSPKTQQNLRSIEKIAAARERAITAQARVAAATALTDIARSDAPAETRRKAAAMILRVKPARLQDTTATRSPMSPKPLPSSQPTDPSMPGSRTLATDLSPQVSLTIAQSQTQCPQTGITESITMGSERSGRITTMAPRLIPNSRPAYSHHPNEITGRVQGESNPVPANGVEPPGPVAYCWGPSLRSSPHRVSEHIDHSPRRIAAWSIGMKKDIHPTFYPSCKVFHNGEVVMTVGATVPELHVDVWSGSHPFFTGKSQFVDAAGRVEKFQRKFAGNYFQKKAK